MLPQIVTVNPMAKSRRKHSHKKRHARRAHYRAHQPVKQHRSRRRRVDNLLSVRGLSGALLPAAVGGAGAIGVDVALAYIPLPAMLSSGWGRVAVQVAAAFGLGFAASKIAGRHNGQMVTAGALTVTAYSALKQVLAPTLGQSVKGLSGLADFTDYARVPYGEQSATMVGGMGAYMQPRLGAYMNPAAFVTTPQASPLRSKQMGAYMRQGGFGGTSIYMDDAAGM